MLFIIAMDMLHRLFAKAVSDGVLKRMRPSEIKYQCSLYADDVIMFIKPTVQEALAVKHILNLFGEVSGLQTNMTKCSITPIFGGEAVLDDIVGILGCQVQPFPIRYLGLPLSTKAIPKASFQALVEHVAAKLPPCHDALMARSGRLIWIKSVLRSVPIYAMMAESLPAWAPKEIDAICRQFFWAGANQSVRGKCMVDCPTCCRPTELGGLGITDIKLMGYALQTRWLWLQKADQDRAWSQLPIKTCPQVQAFFKASTYSVVGNGEQTFFWEDRWLNRESVGEFAPCLLSLVPQAIRSRQTVSMAMNNRTWARSFTGGMSMQAIIDYLHLWQLLEGVQLTGERDRTMWRWTASGEYTAKSAYTMLHAGSSPFPGHKLIWKTWAPLKVKIFLWLAMRRRNWTGDRRRRHGLEARENCYLCDQEPETIDHICSFTREIWFLVLRALEIQSPQAAVTTLGWWRRIRAAAPGERRKGLDTLFALVSWQLWKERNARCFRSLTASIAETLHMIKIEADRWIEAGAQGLRCLAQR